MKTLCILYILCCTMASFSQKHIEKNGVSFHWEFEGDKIKCKIIAPGAGWLAVGFNDKNQLQGTNLIMGASENDFFKMSDRYIVAAGDHRSMISMGVGESLSNRSVEESSNQSIMTFEINTISTDKYHKNLNPGKEIYLLLAYSRSDDFDHHSTMRTSIIIHL